MILQHLQKLKYRPLSLMRFSEEKDKEDKIKRIQQKIRKQIQGSYKHRSAMLYDRYMQSRKKAALSLDDYQIHITFIIERMPIYMPYKQKNFQYYKTLYSYRKRTGYNIKIPKQLFYQMQQPKIDRDKPQNQVTHRIKKSQIDVQDYHENSRNWQLADPTVTQPRNIQAYSSNVVFFIVKDNNGEWRFPSRALLQKETLLQIFDNFTKQLFNGTSDPKFYFCKKQPALVTQKQDDSLDRGKGIRQFHYRGITINGFPQLPNQLFTDYAWVPKPLLAQYFDDKYFNKVIRAAINTQ